MISCRALSDRGLIVQRQSSGKLHTRVSEVARIAHESLVHVRNNGVGHLQLQGYFFPLVVKWQSDIEDVQDHRDVDEKGCIREVPARTHAVIHN